MSNMVKLSLPNVLLLYLFEPLKYWIRNLIKVCVYVNLCRFLGAIKDRISFYLVSKFILQLKQKIRI